MIWDTGQLYEHRTLARTYFENTAPIISNEWLPGAAAGEQKQFQREQQSLEACHEP